MEIVCRIHENRFASWENANGRRIEKVPEMYTALKEIASMQPEVSYDEEYGIHEDCGHCWDMISIAKDALKKARGEE